MDFSGLISSLGVYLSGLESFFLAHFGPSSPPFLTQLEALPSTLLESFKALLTGDPTTFFLYITLPILMFSAFRGKGKELDKQDKERKQKVSLTSTCPPFLRLLFASFSFEENLQADDVISTLLPIHRNPPPSPTPRPLRPSNEHRKLKSRRIDPSFRPKGRMGREQEEGTHR